MIVVIPAVIGNKTDAALLRGITGQDGPIGLTLARELAQSGATVHVLAETEEVAASLAGKGLKVQVVQGLAEPGSGPFVPGAGKAVRCLMRGKHLRPDQLVAVLDYRNLRLKAQSVGDALDKAAANPDGVVASMMPTRDYPTQFFVNTRLLAMDTLIFLEPEHAWPSLSKERGLKDVAAFSRRFYFNWPNCDIWEKIRGFYAFTPAINCQPSRLIPIHASEVSGRLRSGQPVFCLEDGLSGRRLALRESSTKKPRRAVSALGDQNRFPLEASLDGEGIGVILTRKSVPWPGNLTLLAWPFNGDEFAPGRSLPLGTGRKYRIDTPCDGLIAALVQTGEEEDLDFFQPVANLDGIWKIDPFSKERQDPKNNRPLLQRQDFRAMFKMDGALLAGPARMLASPDAHSQSFLPLFLSEEEGLRVESEIDLLRLDPPVLL